MYTFPRSYVCLPVAEKHTHEQGDNELSHHPLWILNHKLTGLRTRSPEIGPALLKSFFFLSFFVPLNPFSFFFFFFFFLLQRLAVLDGPKGKIKFKHYECKIEHPPLPDVPW